MVLLNPIEESLELHLAPSLRQDKSLATSSSQSSERDALSRHRLARHHHQRHAAVATMCVCAAERDDLPPVNYPSTLLHDAIFTHTFCGRAGISTPAPTSENHPVGVTSPHWPCVEAKAWQRSSAPWGAIPRANHWHTQSYPLN